MRSVRDETGMNLRLATPAFAVLAMVFALAAMTGAGACSAEEPAPVATRAPSLARQWEFVGHESDGEDLVVSIRIHAPVELTVVLDGERTPDSSSVPKALGIARFRFRNVTPGDHSVKVSDAAGNSTSRGIDTSPPPVVAEGTDFVLKVGGKAQVGDAGPVVAFKGVLEDSRCPTDAYCVQAGEAVVALAVGGIEVRVTVPREGEGTATTGGYAITVSGLEPLPSSTRSIGPEQYRATVRVRGE